MKFDDYSILSTLYESELSLILKAVRKEDLKPVVIKLLNSEYPSSEQTAKYKYEFNLMQQLQSEGTVNAHDLFNYGHTLALVLEDFEAVPLKSIDFDTVPLIETLELFVKIAKILDEIHRQHILHKDINPSNILWNQSTNVVKISDFGIAHKLSADDAEIKKVELLEGTLAYISPEQTGRINRSLDYRGDYYSLGATFYELLSGQQLFKKVEDAMEIVHSHIAVMPKQLYKVNPSIPIVLSDIIMKLLFKNPEDRYQSMQGLIFDLNHCIQQLKDKHMIKHFEIGMKDFSTTFKIPKKLYGRESDIEEMTDLYKSVCDGHKDWLLVYGYSGVGKSALIHALKSPVVKTKGLYLEGKYDKYKRDIPHSAVIDTLKQLATLMVAAPQDMKDYWKKQLQDEVGSLAAVIVDVIPEMKLVFGERTKLVQLPPREERQRLLNAFKGLLKAVASYRSPIVLFLDDLQWVDQASLEFIEEVINSDISHIMIISAYRENEVDETHPLTLVLQKMKESGNRVHKLCVKPLKKQFINALISDAMGRAYQETESLADFVMEKTQGNPFFTKNLLTHLVAEQVIWLDRDALQWSYYLDHMRETKYLNHVSELISFRISKLPVESKILLQHAAVLGNPFNLEWLSLITNKTIETTRYLLEPVLRDDLISSVDNKDEEVEAFSFIHDQVQQTAYEFCEKKNEIHGSIGLLLLENLNLEETGHNIFNVVDHLNKGLEYIKSSDIHLQMIGLNIKAAKQAQKTAAFKSAYDYCLNSIQLIGESSWNDHFDLRLQVFKTSAEVAYLTGAYNEMEQYCKEVLAHSDTIEDKNLIYQIRIGAAMAQDSPNLAIDIAVEALSQLGLELPRNPNKLGLIKYLGRVQFKLRRFDEAKLLNLEPMTDQQVLAQMDILSSVASAAYLATQELFLIISLIQVELSLKHGRTDMLANAFSLYAMILAGALQQYNKAYKYGKIALKLSEQEQNKRLHSKVHLHLCNFNFHWKESKQSTMERYMRAYHLGLESGDTEYAAWSIFFYSTYAFYKGSKLDELKKVFESSAKNIVELNQEKQLNYNKLHLVLVKALGSEEFYDINEVSDSQRQSFEKRNDSAGLFYLDYCSGIYAIFMSQPEEAMMRFERAQKYLDSVISTNSFALFHYYQALAVLMQHDTASLNCNSTQLRLVRKHLRKLKKWALHMPSNYQHCYQLVYAEYLRVTGNLKDAEGAYDIAIEVAGENQYLQEEALACELAAAFYHWKKRFFISKNYSAKAAYLYEKWGAKLKAKELKLKDQTLLVSASRTYKRDFSKSTTGHRTTQVLDLESIIKASQMLSKEVEVHKLLKRFMKLIIENAGAQEGMILLEKDNVFNVEMRWDPKEEDILNSEPEQKILNLESQLEYLPKSLIQYVKQLKHSVIIDDASRDELVKDDPYIKGKKVKSILCIPVFLKGTFGGMLYLENNASTHAFREEHVETLQMMTTQASISLDNARLYEQLEDKVRERTEELRELTEKYQMLSVTDQLTGLFNRRKLDEVLMYEFKKTQRYNHLLAMILLDIDHFKSVNDTYGHPVGDKVLVILADLLKQGVRHTDTVGRWGGEEFMVICPDTSAEEAVHLAEHLRAQIEHAEMPFERNITSSFGLSEAIDKLTVEQMVHYADEGLYEAKSTGRNKVVKK